MTRLWILWTFVAIVSIAPRVSHGQFPMESIAEDAFEEFELEAEEEEEDEIITDRDSFTPSTSVVGTGWFVLESAYSFIDNRGVAETHSYPEILARYGVSDNIELRFGWNYEVGGAGNPISGNVPDEFEEGAQLERESTVLYGAKFFLTEQCGWTPESSLIVQGYTPTSGEANDSSFTMSYVGGWKLANNWEWDSAIRYSTGIEEEDHFNVWAPSTVLKVPFCERWKGHVEYFSIFTEGREEESTQHFISPGVHYLVCPDLEVGVRFGWGLNEQAPNFFTNAGVGLRF